MSPNSTQRRKAAAKAVGVIASVYTSSTVPGILGKVMALPSVGSAIVSTALPYVPQVIRTVANDVVSTFFPKPTLGGLVVQATAKHAPSFVPLMSAFVALSIVEMGMMLKFLKAIFNFIKRDPSVIEAQTAFKYVGRKVNYSIDLPWNLLLSVLSMISLVYDRRVRPNGKVARVNRWISLGFLLTNLIRWYCVMHWSWLKSPIGSRYVTRLITSTLRTDDLTSSQQRQVFTEIPLVRAGPTQNHTHGASAACRNAGSATAALAANALGKTPYYIQMSLSDVRKGRDGDRSYHWAKDVGVPARDFHFDPENQAAVLVDVDHYVDMPNLLARFPGTYFITTFQPSSAACSEGEFSFRFTRQNKVQYRVSGGAVYEHEVWDYSGDTLLAEICSITKRQIVAYHVDRKKLHDHHVLIMLTVIGKFEMPSFVPSWLSVQGKSLERLRPVIDNHVVIDVIKEDGLYRSVAILGDYTSVTLPRSQFDAAHAVATVAKVPLTPAMVASNIAPSDAAGLPIDRLPPGHAAIVASYVRAGVPESPPVVYPPSECVVPIYFAKHDYDAPVPMKAFGSPLIGPCYAYADSLASDDKCITGRVEAFLKAQSGPVPPKLAGYMVEFAERLIPVPHLGIPLELDEVQQRQDRPSQRHILDEASVSGSFFKTIIRAFVKKETAVKPSDPRNISTLAPQVKLFYSAYLYAFHFDVMAKQKWYAFRYNPKECADRVCEVVKDAKHAVPADASRFDGHVNRNARVLERIILLRQFDRQYHSELNELLDKQIGIPGVTTEGRKYMTGTSRASGSPETSDLNSVDTAFIGYCAWRETLINGRPCSPDEAWSQLGLYGGDDSLEGEVDPEALRKSAKLMGQDYKIKVINRGDIGVEFLNRQFGPDVWTGDPNSMANPSRLLSKLWVGPAHLRNPLQRFAERASGYYRMDRNSPVIGPIVRLAHQLLGEYTEGELMPWAGHFSLDTNWPNEDSGWMVDVFEKFIPDFNVDRYIEWIQTVEQTESAEMLLRAPMCTAEAPHPQPAVSCVLDDHLVQIDKVELPPVEESVEIKFGSFDPVVIEATALTPAVNKHGAKGKKPQKQAAQTSHKRVKTDPRSWTPPKDPSKLDEWKKFQAKMIIRYDKQEA